MAVYSFQRKCVLYFAVKGHSFGLVSSVVNFNRLPHLLVEVAVRLFAVPCTHFVDDYCAVDLKIGRGSGQQALVSLHEEVGFVGVILRVGLEEAFAYCATVVMLCTR